MNHDEIVAAIVARAKRSKGLVLTHYCAAGWMCTGDRGLPDLVLAGPFGVAWLEVKTPAKPKLSPEQVTWKYTLQGSGQRVYVVGASELAGDLIDRIVSALALGQPGFP